MPYTQREIAEKDSPTRWPKWAVVGLLLMVPLLAACKEKTDSVGIRGYNHTDQLIEQFTINGGSGGSSVGPHEGGGSLTCCATIPAKWRPGLEVKIRWSDAYYQNERERVFLIPAYDEAGTKMTVHFLRGGDVKVFVTGYALWHPDYPLKGEEAELTPGVTPSGPWGD